MKVIVNEEQYDKLITESRGYKKSLEKWNNIIVDEIMKSLFEIDDHDVISLPKLAVKYKGKDFFNDLPIESIIIDIEVDKYNDIDDTGLVTAEAGFESAVATMYEDIIEDVEFILHIRIPDLLKEDKKVYQSLYDYLKKIMIHEILHVYEWYNRGLNDPSEKKNCMYMYTEGNFDGDIIDRIGYLLYITLSFEMNAFVQQGGYILRQTEPKNREEFNKELKNLFIYRYIQSLINFDDKEVLKEIKRLSPERVYKLFDLKDCYYSKKDSEGDMIIKKENVSIEKFLSDIKKLFNIRGEAMKRKLQKMIVDII